MKNLQEIFSTREGSYVIHINALKHTINHVLVLEKVHSVIEFNQEVWLKLYIDMNSELRKMAWNYTEKM